MLGLGNIIPNAGSITPVFNNDYSISLDGDNDYIELSPASNIASWPTIYQQGSISVWVKVDTTSSNGTIVSLLQDSNNFISLYYDAASNATVAVWKVDGSGSVSTTSISDTASVENTGNFHHIVYSWVQADKIRLYIDGNLADEEPSGGSQLPAWGVVSPNTSNIDYIAIGHDSTSGGGDDSSVHFNGNINNFSLWNGELDATDVSLIYNNNVPNDVMTISSLEPESRCIAYYKCEPDGGVASTNLVNSSILGFGKDATLENGASYAKN